MNEFCTMCDGKKVAAVVGPQGVREGPCPACVMTPPGLRVILSDNRTIPIASVDGKVTLRELTPEQLVATGTQGFIDQNSTAPPGFTMAALIVLASELARTQKALAAVEASATHDDVRIRGLLRVVDRLRGLPVRPIERTSEDPGAWKDEPDVKGTVHVLLTGVRGSERIGPVVTSIHASWDGAVGAARKAARERADALGKPSTESSSDLNLTILVGDWLAQVYSFAVLP